jgi:hypothetical protein
VTRARDPFPVTQALAFSADARTRVMLFAQNVALLPGETASALTATAEDATHNVYPLTVERVDPVQGFEWMSSVVVRLSDQMTDSTGEVLVGVTLRGVASNRVRFRVGGARSPTSARARASTASDSSPPTTTGIKTSRTTPVDPNSANLIASMGLGTSLHPDFGTVWNGAPNGIPYVVVSGSQTKVQINFNAYGDESDPGPYPVPPDAPVEGGAERHGRPPRHRHRPRQLEALRTLLGLPDGAGWTAASGAVYDLNSNALRPAGWTSADAAGLPVFPGLVRYDEVFGLKQITHALRFTASRTRRAYVSLRATSRAATPTRTCRRWGCACAEGFVRRLGFSPAMQVILRALKKYGMILADNGSNWYVSGAPDPRWSDDELNT